MINIPNKRSSEEEYREKLSIRLPRRILQQLDSLEGSRTKQIEEAVVDYLKKKMEKQEESTRQ